MTQVSSGVNAGASPPSLPSVPMYYGPMLRKRLRSEHSRRPLCSSFQSPDARCRVTAEVLITRLGHRTPVENALPFLHVFYPHSRTRDLHQGESGMLATASEK